MMEVSRAVRDAYVNKLKGSITYDSKVVPVFGKVVPPNATFPYIYVSTQQSSNASSKSCFSNNHVISIEIVSRSMDGNNEWETDVLSSEVKFRIATMHQIDYPAIDSDFWFVQVEFSNDTELVQRTETDWIFRKIITFNNIVDQTIEWQ